MEKVQTALDKVEQQLGDSSLYEDSAKDKLKALESLAKIKGMFTEKKEVTVTNTTPHLSCDYDTSKLSVDELFQLRELLEKAKIEPIK